MSIQPLFILKGCSTSLNLAIIFFPFHETEKTLVRLFPVHELFFTVHETEFPGESEMNGNILIVTSRYLFLTNRLIYFRLTVFPIHETEKLSIPVHDTKKMSKYVIYGWLSTAQYKC
jgi:hypothetical protein